MGCGASSRANNSPAPPGNPRGQFDANHHHMYARTQALTPCPPYKHGTPISEGQLKHQREEFWSTRIGGNAIMWQAIQTACEAMIVGDFLLANAIVEASAILTPNGTLDTCYDETGYLYKVPMFLYANPIELVEGNTPVSISPPLGQDDGGDDTVASGSRKEKEHTGTAMKLKVRINPGDLNFSVTVYSDDTIAQLKRAIQQQSLEAREKIPSTPICDESRQRIMFMGKELQNNNLISQVGVDDGRVVQVFVRPATSTSTNSIATVASLA